MKTKPTSIRFDTNDLLLAQNLSGIKKPQKLIDLLIAEYVKPLKGSLIELPKDYMNFKNIAIQNEGGSISKLKSSKETLSSVSAVFVPPENKFEYFDAKTGKMKKSDTPVSATINLTMVHYGKTKPSKPMPAGLSKSDTLKWLKANK